MNPKLNDYILISDDMQGDEIAESSHGDLVRTPDQTSPVRDLEEETVVDDKTSCNDHSDKDESIENSVSSEKNHDSRPPSEASNGKISDNRFVTNSSLNIL